MASYTDNEPKIYDQFKTPANDWEESARLIQFPGDITDPRVRARITEQRQTHDDEEAGKLETRHILAIAGIGVAVLAYVTGLAGSNATAGEGFIKRVHQLEKIIPGHHSTKPAPFKSSTGDTIRFS